MGLYPDLVPGQVLLGGERYNYSHSAFDSNTAHLSGAKMKLRSIELEVPDRESAVRFLRDTWGLLDAGERNGTSYLRGTEDIPYVVSVAQASEPAVAAVTFSGSRPELAALRKRAAAAGARLGPSRDFDEPGAGSGFLVE